MVSLHAAPCLQGTALEACDERLRQRVQLFREVGLEVLQADARAAAGGPGQRLPQGHGLPCIADLLEPTTEVAEQDAARAHLVGCDGFAPAAHRPAELVDQERPKPLDVAAEAVEVKAVYLLLLQPQALLSGVFPLRIKLLGHHGRALRQRRRRPIIGTATAKDLNFVVIITSSPRRQAWKTANARHALNCSTCLQACPACKARPELPARWARHAPQTAGTT
mmetsp:Transcript_18043/g.50115  ORF Transcript_18043/g.50115 Transcript_18043/m.50115 type:complete len:222 (+) Transcript_18043:1437-2102(+)